MAEARAVEAAGADIDQGIGWHEARAADDCTEKFHVPPGGLAARRLKDGCSMPVIASNRINTPEVAEACRGRCRPRVDGAADARPSSPARRARGVPGDQRLHARRPGLPRSYFPIAVKLSRQPKAGADRPTWHRRRRGSASRWWARDLQPGVRRQPRAKRGHAVTLYEAGPRIGGQLDLGAIRRDPALLPGTA